MFRTFILNLTNPWVWRSPESTARKLRAFAAAETGSRMDLILASTQTKSLERSALYLRHALDESRHATQFTDFANRIVSSDHQEVDIEALFENLGEIDFLAFVHLGERRGRRQFDGYIKYFANSNRVHELELFQGIVKDERMHEIYTWRELVKIVGSDQEANRCVRRMQFWEFRRDFVRTGRFLSNAIFHFSMYTLYVISLPFAILVRILRPIRNGWHPEN